MKGPRVLVVGAGHAGLAATHGVLNRLPNATVALFEPRETHLLKPRLMEGLAEDFPVEIPLAPLVDSPRIEHVRERVTAVDAIASEVEAHGHRYRGDFLVIAAGARTKRPPLASARTPEKAGAKTRGRTGARSRGRTRARTRAKTQPTTEARIAAPEYFQIDSLEDVLDLRKHLQSVVAEAAGKASAARRRSLLSVLVVGGGYTGVEAAAEIAIHLRRLANASSVSPALVHVTLCEAGQRLFAGGVPDDELSQRVDEGLARRAVDVRVGEMVEFQDGVPIVGRKASIASTVILATGIEGVLPVPKRHEARSRRWSVDATLRVEGARAAFAAGDVARMESGAIPGAQVVASAQHAVQAGSHAARVIAQMVKGKRTTDFQPATVGEFVTLGDRDVVGWIQIAGRRFYLSGIPAATARAAAFARYLARLKLGAVRL